ncbi:MAG: 3D domain-containing protein [Firmicutes bacterium]|nr:3D domain-containing protein [Bacillota bacterium]
MTNDRKIIENIKNLIEAEGESFEEEDALIIEKIQALLESRGEEIEAIADRIEAEELRATQEINAAELDAALDEEAEPEPEPEPLPIPPTGEHKKSWMTAIEEKFNSLNPKTKVGKFFTADRHNATLAAMIALTLLTGGWQLADYLIPQKVVVEYQTFEGSEEAKVTTRGNTVEAAIADSGFEVLDTDYVYPKAEHPIKDGDRILIKKSELASAEIVGEKQDFYLIPGTVEQNLEFNNVVFDNDDIVIPARDTEVSLKSKIVMKELHKLTEEKQEVQKARNVVVLDPKLYSGKVQITKGHDGEGIFTYTTTYINGEKVKTEREVKKWIDEPVDNALRLGTSLTGHTGEYKVSRTFIANTTAYYMGENAYGASGGHCVYGTCAVDPRVIPYGTLLFVEGYGVAVANDCGGAIKGDKLDLWMHSFNESCQWGRRYVKTYVLTK